MATVDLTSAILLLIGSFAAFGCITFCSLCLRTTWQYHQSNNQSTKHNNKFPRRRLSFPVIQRRLSNAYHSSFDTSHARFLSNNPINQPLLVPVQLKPKAKLPALSSKKSSLLLLSHSHYLTANSLTTLIKGVHSKSVPVIITLTTLPSRIHHIDKCLLSLKKQTFPITKIYLCLPKHSDRESSPYSIPDRILRDSMIEIIECDVDRGSLTRWTEPVKQSICQEQDCLLIGVDDDVIYDPDFVACCVRHSINQPTCALGFAGYSLLGEPYVHTNVMYARRADEILLDRDDFGHGAYSDSDDEYISPASRHPLHSHSDHLPPLYPMEAVDVLSSFRGIILHSKWLMELENLLDKNQSINRSMYYCDDVIISGLLSRQGISRVVILCPWEIVLGKLKLKNGKQTGALSQLATASSNQSHQHNQPLNAVLHACHYNTVVEAIVGQGWFPSLSIEMDEGKPAS